MKEKLRNNIDFCGNKVNLKNDFTENDLLSKINEIYDSRKNIVI